MANGRYTKWIGAMLDGVATANWTSDTIKAVLLRSSAYTVDIDNDEFLDDIPGGAQVASCTLTGVTRLLGVIDCDDPSFGVVGAGAACDAIAIYKDTGSGATSRLLYYMDTFDAGMPVTPDGASSIDVVINAAGLFEM